VADVLIFRSSKLFDADLIAAALEENGIPFYRRRDAGGVVGYEAPGPGATHFPGVFHSIYVPAELESEAREVIEGSLVDPEEESRWEPSPADRRQWRYFVAALMVGAAIIIYKRCFGH
jgi:hypothetical protein